MNRLLLCLLLASQAHGTMDFNGSSNYVKIDEAVISATPFTISFWYRSSATTSTRAIYYLAAVASTTPLVWISRLGASDVSAAPCDVAGHARIKYRSADSGCDINVCVAKIVNDGNWHFIAARATSASNFSIKVDDVTGTGTDGDCINFPAVDRTAVGARWRGSADFFDDGDVEDVRTYNRALSDAELDSLYASRSRLVNTAGLVAYWRLDDGPDGADALGATAALDSSGNGKHLAATAAPTYRASDFLRYP